MTENEARINIPYATSNSRLLALLARFASNPGALAAERRLLPATSSGRLGRVLQEIDEIILPRTLQLRIGDREAARLTVSHRHLIRMEIASLLKAGSRSEVIPSQFATSLVELAGLKGELSIEISRRVDVAGQGHVAMSAKELERALGRAPASSPFDVLMQRLVPLAVAELRWSDKNPRGQVFGDPDWRAILTNGASRALRAGKHPLANASIPSTRLEGTIVPVSDRHILAILSSADQGIALILPRAAGLSEIASWQAMPK